MKFKRTVIVATFVVTTGLLVGTSAAQEPTVIFEGGTTKASGIRNLEYEGTFYNVDFTSPKTAAEVYGEYPGQFDTNLSTVQIAADLVNSELTSANATDVGAVGSEAVPCYSIGYQSGDVGISGAEGVFHLDSCGWDSNLGTIWQNAHDNSALNAVPYNDNLLVWAKITEASASDDVQVIFEGNNATGIRNLEVNGVLYDVEFRYDSAENIYGEDLIFDFQEDGIAAARLALIDALNSEPAVERVGPNAGNDYSIGFGDMGSPPPYLVEVSLDVYDWPRGPWVPSSTISYTTTDSIILYADFTEVPQSPTGEVPETSLEQVPQVPAE